MSYIGKLTKFKSFPTEESSWCLSCLITDTCDGQCLRAGHWVTILWRVHHFAPDMDWLPERSFQNGSGRRWNSTPNGRFPGRYIRTCRHRRKGRKKKLLTDSGLCINLSVFVDTTNLMQSGRGTGPLKPRQPVKISILTQVPNPAWMRVRPGKMRRDHLFL